LCTTTYPDFSPPFALKSKFAISCGTIFILDEASKAYKSAMDHAHFLLRIEREEKPSTYNHYFNSEVQKKRLGPFNAAFDKLPKVTGVKADLISTTDLRNLAENKDDMQQTCEDILDVLSNYYKVSRKRFVDVICRQVIGHFLSKGERSPLKVFSPELVMGLEAEELEMIAGEDAKTKERRSISELEIKCLEAAMKLLRG
jgi:hypothetical protein